MTRLQTLAPFLSALLFVTGAVMGPADQDTKDEAIRRDSTPPLLSLYLPIPLGVPRVEDPATGIFVPENYRAGPSVDLLLFLRGYDIKRPEMATAVVEYWNSPRHPVLKSFLFREEVNRSGKNLILAVPALGPSSEAGTLTDRAGFQTFLGRVLDGLWRSGPHAGRAQPPTLRHLILAAHSGGGVPLRRLAQAIGDDDAFKGKLKACWGFDSIYGVKDKDADFWADWAQAHPNTQVTMFYLFTDKEVGKDSKQPISAENPRERRVPTGTTFPAQELERLARVRGLTKVAVVRGTEATTLNHTEVPRAHLASLLKAAAYLENR